MSQTGERRIVIVKQRTVSAAGTTNSVATLSGEIAKYTSCIFVLNVTAQSGTSPTLDIYVQQELPIPASSDTALSVPSGPSLWNDFVHFTQVAGTTGTWFATVTGGSNTIGVIKDAALSAGTAISGPIGSSWRVKEVVAGTSPSFTYTVSAILIP